MAALARAWHRHISFVTDTASLSYATRRFNALRHLIQPESQLHEISSATIVRPAPRLGLPSFIQRPSRTVRREIHVRTRSWRDSRRLGMEEHGQVSLG